MHYSSATTDYRRQYVDGKNGQIHLHVWGDLSKSDSLFLCLPPSPYGGRAFATMAPYLAASRPVAAMDYPAMLGSPTIQDYARAALSVIDALGANRDVQLIGFHTGCLVAIEAAFWSPSKISKITLIDIPFFDPDVQADLAKKSLAVVQPDEDLSSLQSAWDRSVTRQWETVPLIRRFEMFVDHISRGAAAGQPFEAAFTYPCTGRFSAVDCPAKIIATRAGLFNETLKAQALIKGSELLVDQTITVSVLEQAAEQTAKHILGQE